MNVRLTGWDKVLAQISGASTTQVTHFDKTTTYDAYGIGTTTGTETTFGVEAGVQTPEALRTLTIDTVQDQLGRQLHDGSTMNVRLTGWDKVLAQISGASTTQVTHFDKTTTYDAYGIGTTTGTIKTGMENGDIKVTSVSITIDQLGRTVHEEEKTVTPVRKADGTYGPEQVVSRTA